MDLYNDDLILVDIKSVGKTGISLFVTDFLTVKTYQGNPCQHKPLVFISTIFDNNMTLDPLTSPRCKILWFCLQNKEQLSFIDAQEANPFLYRQQGDMVSKRSSFKTSLTAVIAPAKMSWSDIESSTRSVCSLEPILLSVLCSGGRAREMMSFSVTDQYSITKISLTPKFCQ